MKIIISLLLGYIISGIAKVIKDITSRPINRPGWANKPTIGKILTVSTMWGFMSIYENIMIAQGNKARGIIFGLLGVIVQTCIVGGLFWLVITAVGYLLNLF